MVPASSGAAAARLGLIAAALATAGCTGSVAVTSQAVSGDRTGGGTPAPLIVSVAASAKDAFTEIAQKFGEKAGVQVQVNASSSSGLANQILSGAPVDVFVSANEKWAAAVVQAGRSVESVPLLSNRLVLVVPAGNPAGIGGPEDLLAPRVKRIALAGQRVPAGIYADQALRALKIADRLAQEDKVIRGQDVRVTLSYVERGEVDAGIVYATDAAITPHVEVVYTFEPTAHARIVYPAMLLDEGSGKPAAQAFFAYLRTADAAAVFERYGFQPVKAQVD